jgi:hypothetical protein
MKLHKWIFVGALSIVGCTKTSSEGLDTSALWAELAVLQNPNGINARAEFRVSDGGTYVELQSGDQISCNGMTLRTFKLSNAVWYNESVPAAPAGQSYTFELTRNNGKEKSTATVQAPRALAISAPAASSMAKIGQPIELTWSPANLGDPIVINAYADCIDRIDLDNQPDDGMESVGGAMGIAGNGKSCMGSLDVARMHRETLGAPFKGGSRLSSFTSDLSLSFGP